MGSYLPPEVRQNDYWPPEVVAGWTQRLADIVPRSERYVDHVTDGVRLSAHALSELASDPFQGAVERRVLAPDLVSSDMEAAAARSALAAAGAEAAGVDLLLTHSMVPDYMCNSQAAIVHHKVGLSPGIPALALDVVCTSIVFQLSIAEKFIRAGEAAQALLTQSSACTRLMPKELPYSPWHGDAGTAAIVRAVEPGLGLLGTAFRTDGSLTGAFVATVPNRRWHEDGSVIAWSDNKPAARRMQLQGADIAARLIDEALARAGVAAGEVQFFACHQPTVWLRRVVQAHAGLVNAKSCDTFAWTGSISSSNIGLQLEVGVRDGLLKKGMPVVLFTMASGMTAAAGVMRWAY
jgi:3-oxoacyl-[acyl-carrier-protein] synthase-3